MKSISRGKPPRRFESPGSLDSPRARADVSHSQVRVVGGDLWVDGVAEDLGPQGMHQIDAWRSCIRTSYLSLKEALHTDYYQAGLILVKLV